MKKFEIQDKKGIVNTLFATTLRAAKNWCKLNKCTFVKEIVEFKIA